MLEAEAYRKACDIADSLLARGVPVRSFESISGMIVIRFAGGQTIHAEAGPCSLESFMAEYQRGPPDATE